MFPSSNVAPARLAFLFSSDAERRGENGGIRCPHNRASPTLTLPQPGPSLSVHLRHLPQFTPLPLRVDDPQRDDILDSEQFRMPSGKPKVDRQELSRGLRAKAPLAAQFEDCFQASIQLTQLTDALQASRPHSDELQVHHLTQDCKDKLRVWGDDSGASSRALDYALKCSPNVVRQTEDLLTDLHEVLHQAVALVRPQLESVFESDKPDSSAGEEPATAAEGLGGHAAPEDQDADSGPERFVSEALDVIACLVKLLPTFRTPMDEEDQESAIRNSDVYTDSVDWHIQMAIEAFPPASKALAERLGTNNWRRSQYLHRLQDRPRTATTATQPELGRQVSNRALTRNMSLVGRPTTVANSRQSSRQAIWADYSDTATTVDSHVPSVISVVLRSDQNSATSMSGSQQPSVLQHLVLPEPPVDLATTEEFECPYCHFELPLTVSAHGMTREEWVDHIHLDLKPYMCTFDDCSWSNVMFGVKKDWFQHELEFHRSRTVWSCGICRSDFDVEKDFVAHLMDSHQHLETENLSPMVDSCKRYSQDEPSVLCHLCGLSCSGLADLEDHAGGHLELFALAAIHDPEFTSPEDACSEGYNNMIDEYLDDLEPPVTEAKTIRATSPPPPANGGAVAISRIADTSDASNLDDLDKEVIRKQRGPQWNANLKQKVQTFLDKQAVPGKDSDKPKHTNIPERDKAFLGRDDDLEAIHKCLPMGQICTVTGRGGIGKTAIAKEYLHRYINKYKYIFWVEAENAGTCQEKYNMIASVLDTSDKPLPDQGGRTYLVRECLTKAESRWLLIFDNVATWNDIARYVPKALARSKGSVLITSRSTGMPGLMGLPPWQNQVHVELAPWSLDHSREFLLTSISKLKRDNLRAHEEYELAEKVVEVVERLPLAVNMIVGYIKVSRCSLAEFLEMWEERASRRRPRRRRVAALEAGIDNTIDSLWDIGIGEVRANCRKLLDVLSFLDPENIPKSLLVGDHDEEYLDFLHVDETLRYKRMIEQLDRQKLIDIKMDDGEPAYGIHRVLQQKIQFDLDDYSFADAFRKAFRLIRKRFPRANSQQVPVPKDMEICRRHMPHVFNFHHIFTEHFKEHKITSTGGVQPVELSELFYDAGFYVWGGQATAYEGLPFLGTADKILDDMESQPNAKVRADIHCMTGLLLLNMGYEERARGTTRLKEAWEIRKAIYDLDSTLDNDVLSQNAANDYCLCLMNTYRFEEAGKILNGCLERYQTVYGPESENPFEYSKYYGNFSIILLWEGRVEEAIRSIEKSLVLTEKFSGKNSQYYRRLFMLACAFLQVGDTQKAFETHLEALNARLELQGKHHENTILSMYAVGATYHHLGDIDNAIEYIKQCIKAARDARWSEEALGRARYHLALLYEERGGEEEAARLLMEEAKKVLDKFRHYAPWKIREAGNDMMIFDDMQGTFTGRYTGRNLLRHLQDRAKRQQEEQRQQGMQT
ncbi:nb-arc and tpr domain-containing protein [Lasiosphaeria hispida]|uniref:Nb-arc and tpr domain-containing protein n=1 Tax=Lasiosphaeria hispida TaxID=260671 RepID=A0AAJ0MGJ8_9PEZI|nr:nb-arc and tpr domain-containing protein [Lasiosphaeria hispida]